MTLDKLGPLGTNFGSDSTSAVKAKESQTLELKARQKIVAVSSQNGAATASKAVASTVSVSVTAKELFNVVNTVSDEEEFDQDKVEQIRREIASGRFPIDEERLAKKFLELEQQLGDLGGQ